MDKNTFPAEPPLSLKILHYSLHPSQLLDLETSLTMGKRRNRIAKVRMHPSPLSSHVDVALQLKSTTPVPGGAGNP